jgi:hypothetical protein
MHDAATSVSCNVEGVHSTETLNACISYRAANSQLYCLSLNLNTNIRLNCHNTIMAWLVVLSGTYTVEEHLSDYRGTLFGDRASVEVS